MPKTISPIIKKIATRKTKRFLSKYLEIIVFGRLKIFDSIKVNYKFSLDNNLNDLNQYIIGTTNYSSNSNTNLGRTLNILDVSYNTNLTTDGILTDELLDYQPTSITNFGTNGGILSLILRGIGLEEFPNTQPEFFQYVPSEYNFAYVRGVHYIDIAENPFYCDCTSLVDVPSCDMPQWVKDGLTEGWIVGFDERDLLLCGEPELVASGCGGTLTCEEITPVIHEECEFVGCNTLYDDEADPIACEDTNPEEMFKPCQGYWDYISICPENYGTCQTTYG